MMENLEYEDFWDITGNVSKANGTGNSSTYQNYLLPYHLTFNDDSIREVALYSLLFVLAAAGNVPVFATLIKNRHRKSRVNLMIMHLAMADLIVTFVMIPLEIIWRITVAWIAGNSVCKLMLFLRAFGPYLSSMVLVCISLDRYFAILHPLKVNDAQRRGKIMLGFAWLISLLCSIPQSVIFHVESHPDFPQFLQCVTFNFFPTDSHKVAYNLFCLATLYGVPLLIIVICYSQILFAMSKRSRDNENDVSKKERFRGRMRLRRSDITHVERARARTLKMTVIIVLTFFWCWTPYVVMSLWYLFDPVSADKVDSRIQSSLFMFAVSNSCVNPLVYGSYVLNFKKVLKQCLCCCCFRRQQHFDQSLTTATCRSQVRDPSGHIRPRKACVNLNHNGKGTYPCVLEEQKLSNHDGTTLCKNKYMSSLSTRAGPHSHCSQGHVPSPYHSANF